MPVVLGTAQVQEGVMGADSEPVAELTAATCNATARLLALATHDGSSMPEVTIGDAGPGSLRRLDKAIAAACGKKVHAKLLRSRREA